MDEAKLCDRIALIQNAKILDVDTLEGILNKNQQNLFAVNSNKMYQLLKDLRAYPDTISCFAFGQKHHLQLKSGIQNLENLNTYLEKKGHGNIQIVKIKPDIEDTFIKLMQDA
jgi:ABC-2 type transport system ATP-binding protein